MRPRLRLPEVSQRLTAQVAAAVAGLRRLDLEKPPGLAESLDWARALHALGYADLDRAAAAATLGAVIKNRADSDQVDRISLAELLAS